MPAAWGSGSRERRLNESLSARSGGLEGPASWPGSVIDVDPMPTCWNGTTVRMRDGPRPRSAQSPGWHLFRDGCPGGESVEAVAARADRVVAGLKEASGRVIMFGHSHFFRILAARWLGLPAADARFYVLGTAALSVLGYEHASMSRRSSSGMTIDTLSPAKGSDPVHGRVSTLKGARLGRQTSIPMPTGRSRRKLSQSGQETVAGIPESDFEYRQCTCPRGTRPPSSRAVGKWDTLVQIATNPSGSHRGRPRVVPKARRPLGRQQLRRCRFPAVLT